ncbi:MAG: hypothetical protein QW759_02400, partial [Candidatus Micrarchaeaceae archaeon]
TSSCEFEVTATDTGTTTPDTATSAPTAKITVIAHAPAATPANVLYYFPIVLYNNQQSTATPAPFQQFIPVNALNYTQYMTYNSNFANFEYFYSNSMIIPSWIESNQSHTIATWVNIANGIPAGNFITIYLGFASNTLNLLSSSGTSGIGEAPQLTCGPLSSATATSSCATYGAYDDGASVFNNYWNFAGNTLPSGWTDGGVAAPYVIVGNYLLVNQTGSCTSAPCTNWAATTSTYATGNILEFFMEHYNYAQPSGGTIGVALDYGYSSAQINPDNSSSNSITVFKNYGIAGSDLRTMLNGVATSSSTFTSIYENFTTSMHSTPSAAYLSIGTAAPGYNNLQSADLTTNVYSSNAAYISLDTFDTLQSLGPFYYIRIRSTPPNGVMPGYSFGSVQPALLKSSFTETGLPSGTEWNVTYDSILNSSTTNTITFMTASGSHAYAVANQIASNVIYFPTPSSGSVVAGNTTAITFATKSATLTFDDSPTTGNIIFNGITYANGASNTVLAGVYAINAIAPSGYNFHNWTASSNVTFANTLAANTVATIYGNSIITANYQPSAVCTISLPTTVINFGSLNPLNNIPTTNAITDDDTGTVGANILVFGGNWILSANALIEFGVSNTTWSSASGVSFATANKLTATPAVTGLTVPAGGSNTIYFGLGIPDGAPSGSYSQTITIENSC